jgi:MFS family permease
VSGILSRVGPDVLYAMFAVFVLTYATDQLGFSQGEALAAVMVASLIEVPLIPFAGWLSDRVDRRLVYAVAAVGAGIWVWVFLAISRSGSLAALIAGVTIGLALHAFMYGPQAAYIAEQFHARLRYTGTSLAYTFAGIIGGAIAPAAFTWLLSRDESGSSVAVYVSVSMVATLVGLAVGRVVVDEVDTAPARVSVER